MVAKALQQSTVAVPTIVQPNDPQQALAQDRERQLLDRLSTGSANVYELAKASQDILVKVVKEINRRSRSHSRRYRSRSRSRRYRRSRSRSRSRGRSRGRGRSWSPWAHRQPERPSSRIHTRPPQPQPLAQTGPLLTVASYSTSRTVQISFKLPQNFHNAFVLSTCELI